MGLLDSHGELYGHRQKASIGADWLIMVCRYNYRRYLFNTELSMASSLPASTYHLNEDYAALLLLKFYSFRWGIVGV